MFKKFLIAIGAFILVVLVLGATKAAQIKQMSSVSHVPPPSAVTNPNTMTPNRSTRLPLPASTPEMAQTATAKWVWRNCAVMAEANYLSSASNTLPYSTKFFRAASLAAAVLALGS